jgi:nicotinamidase-related amidase
MKALIVIDAQNEFSPTGKRPVPGHADIITAIKNKTAQFRSQNLAIAWVRHFNKPTESPAFVPETWGAEFVDGMGPKEGFGKEKEFQKDVYGAFTGTDIGTWLQIIGAGEVEIAGFYAHGCVSTTSREAIMAGLTVYLDASSTASCAIEHELLGIQSANEVRRSALLQLANMGAIIYTSKMEK